VRAAARTTNPVVALRHAPYSDPLQGTKRLERGRILPVSTVWRGVAESGAAAHIARYLGSKEKPPLCELDLEGTPRPPGVLRICHPGVCAFGPSLTGHGVRPHSTSLPHRARRFNEAVLRVVEQHRSHAPQLDQLQAERRCRSGTGVHDRAQRVAHAPLLRVEPVRNQNRRRVPGGPSQHPKRVQVVRPLAGCLCRKATRLQGS
jgi:hypothetical protein